jgi:hypothetical protein
LKIAATLQQSDRVRYRIACRLAPTRPADALRVVDAMASDSQHISGKLGKAMALGWVAAAVAPRDKQLAYSLVDRAFGILMALDLAKFSLGDEAAFLAVQAQRIGYPDMESVVDRVLACRPTARGKSSSTDVVDSEVYTAAFLGLVDTRTARGILDSIESHRPAIGKIALGAWLEAWLLVDAKRGQALSDEAFAAIRNKSRTDCEFRRLVEVADFLAAPLPEKSQYVYGIYYFLPLEEDY